MSAVLDANIIIRLLIPDASDQAERVRQLLDAPNASYWLEDTIFAEIIWVLISFYKVPKSAVCKLLGEVLAIPSIRSNRQVLEQALGYYAEYSFSYTDAYLAAVAQDKGVPVVTFDRGFKKVPSLSVHTP